MQVRVGVRDAAKIVGVSQKRVRGWIKEGRVRAELVEGKFGPTWMVEAASLPPSTIPLDERVPRVRQGSALRDEGRGEGSDRGETGALAGVLGMYSALQEKHESLLVRLGQLEAGDQERKALAARAESLIVAEAQARTEADEQRERATELADEVGRERGRAEGLSGEVKELRRRLTWRTWALEILLLGVAAITAVMWLTRWWPR